MYTIGSLKPCITEARRCSTVVGNSTPTTSAIFTDRGITFNKETSLEATLSSTVEFPHIAIPATCLSNTNEMEAALQSLDSLSDHILQLIFGAQFKVGSLPSASDLGEKSRVILSQQRDALQAALALMRGLLMDAQVKFKNMVDNNKRFVSHMDGTIQTANREVSTLRVELNMANQKLREIAIVKDVCSRCQDSIGMNKIKEENATLSAKNRQLQKEVENLKHQVKSCEKRNKDSIEELKSDRQRLKTDKTELLTQILEMQKTIDDKEEQLRDFIREFEIQMKETDEMIHEADEERSRLSRERNELSRKNDDMTEVVNSLRAELVANEKKIREMETELNVLRQASVLLQTTSKRRSFHMSVEESITNFKMHNNSATEPNPSTQIQDPLLLPASPMSPRHCNGQRGNAMANSSSSEDVNGDSTLNGMTLSQYYSRKPKLVHHFSGSLTRAFRRGRNRKSCDVTTRADLSLRAPRNASFSFGFYSPVDSDVYLGSSRTSLDERSPEEKKEILQNNQNLPMHKWKADAVLVWLELVMHMSQYVKQCAENIKSGKVLLGLTESELEKCLGIQNVLHKRKLCLAIEEFRNPAITTANMSAAGQLDHWWVSEQWLRDVGLTQYASRFREHLIDGRTLTSLTRKDLERNFGMDGKKTHQDSALRGVQLLQMLAFNSQRLDERRQMCQSCDTDLLVWNNSRLIQWAKTIDLKEYSANLRDSGVHGAFIVLDSNFTSDNMATALGIPVNKATVRRHLSSEFETLVRPARDSLEYEILCVAEENRRKSFTSSFMRSSNSRKRSIRSSISRSIGRQLSKDN